jgi:hypothetical protein
MNKSQIILRQVSEQADEGLGCCRVSLNSILSNTFKKCCEKITVSKKNRGKYLEKTSFCI